jgi:predicted Na+-dependent transporter
MAKDTAIWSVKQGKNIFGVLAATALGVVVPSFGQWLQPLITPIVAFLIYSSLYNIKLRNVNMRSYASVLLATLFITYVGLPMISVGLSGFLESDGTLVGLFVVMAAPSTAGSAIIWTRLSGGDVFLSTIASTFSIIFAPIATSILLVLLLHKEVQTLIPAIAAKLGIIIVGALLLRLIIPENTISDHHLEKGSQIAIVLLVYTGVATSSLKSLSLMDAVIVGSIVITLLFCGLLLAASCAAVLNIQPEQTFSLFFTSTFKNLGISLLIAVSFPIEGVIPVIVIYYILQQIAGATITDLDVLSRINTSSSMRTG